MSSDLALDFAGVDEYNDFLVVEVLTSLAVAFLLIAIYSCDRTREVLSVSSRVFFSCRALAKSLPAPGRFHSIV